MDFKIAVVSLLVIVYIVSIIIVCLIIYVCLKLRSINQSHWNIDANPLYSDNRPQTTQSIETRSDLETVLETNKKSNSSLKADSVDSLHNSNNSHIYEDIEDLYIDDSFLGIWTISVRIPTSLNRFITVWKQKVNNVHVRVLVPAKSICMIEKSKDILWHTYISKESWQLCK